MIFNSFQFLWLFTLIFGGYYLISYLIDRKSQGRGSNILLLCTSYALYAQYAPLHTIVLLWVTAVTYVMALSLTKAATRAKTICWVGTLLGIAPLLFSKYYNFLASNIGELFGNQHITGLNWAVPIGISFFTFQAVGYLIDVYKKTHHRRARFSRLCPVCELFSTNFVRPHKQGFRASSANQVQAHVLFRQCRARPEMATLGHVP